HGQRSHAIAHVQPLAARTELLDDADKLVARRERRLRTAKVRPGAELRIGERYAGGEHFDADFSLTRHRDLGLHHGHDLGSTIVTHDAALHVANLLSRCPTCSSTKRAKASLGTSLHRARHRPFSTAHNLRERVDAVAFGRIGVDDLEESRWGAFDMPRGTS